MTFRQIMTFKIGKTNNTLNAQIMKIEHLFCKDNNLLIAMSPTLIKLLYTASKQYSEENENPEKPVV
jgi:exopolysaccharide biosynthesis protein